MPLKDRVIGSGPASSIKPSALTVKMSTIDDIRAQLERFQEIYNCWSGNPGQLSLARTRSRLVQWRDRTIDVIRARLGPFQGKRFADELASLTTDSEDLMTLVARHSNDVVGYLEVLIEGIENGEVELWGPVDDLLNMSQPVSLTRDQPYQPGTERCDRKRVFVVHGREEGVKHKVARWLERIGLEPVILDERAGKSRTLIEKLEQEGLVAFAIALLTGDDRGAPADKSSRKSSWKARARQNVVLELGYFIGRFGRARTCALLGPGVEQPSDFHGVEYVPIDDGDGWKIKLARELQAADMDIDSTKLA